jgi:hypothetical protein
VQVFYHVNHLCNDWQQTDALDLLFDEELRWFAEGCDHLQVGDVCDVYTVTLAL